MNDEMPVEAWRKSHPFLSDGKSDVLYLILQQQLCLTRILKAGGARVQIDAAVELKDEDVLIFAEYKTQQNTLHLPV